MARSKSELIKEISNNYPNFLKKDINKLFDIIIKEIKDSLKKNHRVELRDVLIIEPRVQKARKSRNPKTMEEIYVPEKRTIHFKMSKEG